MNSNSNSNKPIDQSSGASRPSRLSPRPAPAGPRALTVLPVVGRPGRPDVTKHCWEIIQSPDNDLHGACEECYAHFKGQDCWTLWGLREASSKPCCQKREDCATCPVLLAQVALKQNETVQMRARPPVKPPLMRPGASKQVCRYLDAGDVPVPPESDQYISAVSRAVQTRSSSFRCYLRGVHLDVGYVTDMCVSRQVQDCVFLDELRPEVAVHDSALKAPLDKAPEDDVESRTSDVES